MANEQIKIEIDFKSNLDAALRTVNTSLAGVNKSLNSIKNKDLGAPAQNLAKNVARTTKGVQLLNSRLSTTLNILKGAVVAFAFRQAISGIRVVQQSLGSLVKTSILSAAKTEDLNTQFRAFTKTGKEARDIVAELRQFTEATPFQLDEVAQAGRTLLAFGESQEQLTERLTVLGNAAAATGSDIGELARIFGQIQAAGKLTGERFNQLVERGINIGPVLAESLGVAEEELEDLRRAGKITSDDVTRAFNKLAGAGGQFEGSIKRLSETVSGRFSTLKDSVDSVFIALGQSFEPVTKGLLEGLLGASGDIKKFVTDNQQEIAEGFKNAILGIIGSIDSLLASFQKNFAKIFKILDGFGNISSGVAKLFVIGIKAIETAIFKLVQSANAGLSKVFKLLGFKNKAIDLDINAQAAQSTVDELFKELNSQTKSASSDFKDAFTFDSAEKEFTSGVQRITETARNALEKIRQGAANTVIGAPSATNSGSNSGGQTSQNSGFSGIFSSVKNTVVGTFTEAFDEISPQLKNLISDTFSVITDIGSKFGQVLKGGAKGFSDAGKRIDEINKELASTTDLEDRVALEQERTDLIAQQNELTKNGAIDTVGAFVSAIPGIGDAIAGVLDLLKDPDAIAEFIDALADALPEVITALIKAIPKIIDALVRNLPAIIVALVEGVPQIILALVEGMPKVAGAIIDGIIRSVGRIGSAIANAISDAVKNILPFGKSGGFLKRLGFNKGGFVTGAGNKDTVPAMLTPGELVVDRSTGPKLRDFLNSDAAKGSSQSTDMSMVTGLLQAILAESQKEQVVNTSIEIDGNVLAEAILELNRNNARLA